MFFRMLDGDRPYLAFFLSCIGNPASQEQGHSDYQQDKPDSEFVHLRLPSFLPSHRQPPTAPPKKKATQAATSPSRSMNP
jgi:hypothetical protein